MNAKRLSNVHLLEYSTSYLLVLLLVVATGCSEFTGEAKKTGPSALIRVRAEGTEREYEIYQQTQLALIKSSFVLTAAVRDSDITKTAALKDLNDPVEWLESRLFAEYTDESEILEISLPGVNDAEAAMIVDAVTDAYFQEVAESERNEVTRRLEFLRAEHRQTIRDIHETANIVAVLSKDIGTSDSELAVLSRELYLSNLKLHASRISKLESHLLEAEVNLRVLAASQVAEKEKSGNPLPTDDLKNAKRRVDVLAELTKEQRDEYENGVKELNDMIGFSAELLTKKADLETLQKKSQVLHSKISELESQLKMPSRVLRIQRAK